MKYFILTLMIPLLIIVNGCNNTKTLDISNLQEVKTLELKNQDGVIFHGVIKSKRIADLSFQSEGKIIYLPYSRGDFVKKGQTVAVIEAMKLENEVPATVEGKVVEIKVSKGNTVNNKDVLIVLG